MLKSIHFWIIASWIWTSGAVAASDDVDRDFLAAEARAYESPEAGQRASRNWYYFQTPIGVRVGPITPTGESGLAWFAVEPFYGAGQSAVVTAATLRALGADFSGNFATVSVLVPAEHIAFGVLTETRGGKFL